MPYASDATVDVERFARLTVAKDLYVALTQEYLRVGSTRSPEALAREAVAWADVLLRELAKDDQRPPTSPL